MMFISNRLNRISSYCGPHRFNASGRQGSATTMCYTKRPVAQSIGTTASAATPSSQSPPPPPPPKASARNTCLFLFMSCVFFHLCVNVYAIISYIINIEKFVRVYFPLESIHYFYSLLFFLPCIYPFSNFFLPLLGYASFFSISHDSLAKHMIFE